MFSGIWRIKRTNWCGQRSRIGVVILEECINVVDCVISSIHKICVMCRNFNEVIGSSVLDFPA